MSVEYVFLRLLPWPSTVCGARVLGQGPLAYPINRSLRCFAIEKNISRLVFLLLQFSNINTRSFMGIINIYESDIFRNEKEQRKFYFTKESETEKLERKNKLNPRWKIRAVVRSSSRFSTNFSRTSSISFLFFRLNARPSRSIACFRIKNHIFLERG